MPVNVLTNKMLIGTSNGNMDGGVTHHSCQCQTLGGVLFVGVAWFSDSINRRTLCVCVRVCVLCV